MESFQVTIIRFAGVGEENGITDFLKSITQKALKKTRNNFIFN